MGQQVKIVTSDGLETIGLLVPRYSHADSDHIVLKLKSGYNIGIRADTINSLTVISPAAPGSFGSYQSSREAISQGKSGLKKLLLISTGGTIASRVDYRTGAVHPALSASDLYSAVPELSEYAEIDPVVVFSVYSENLTPSDWQTLSEKIVELSGSQNPAGIVVMMGTDTLAYASAALSFSLLGLSIPVVLVGAQRSSDRPSSDAALNLTAAVSFAVNSGWQGVYVAMHETTSDDSVAIHWGNRVRKNHTSRRDAFRSIDVPLVARVKGREIFYSSEPPKSAEDIGSLKLKTKFEDKVGLIKFYPGFDSSVLDYYVKSRNFRGLIVEGTGLGHVSSKTVRKISEIVAQGVFVGITSQCIWGHVDLDVYDTGRDLISAGAVPLEDTLPETAYAKLSWAIANFDDFREIMLRNVAGEFSERLVLNSQSNPQDQEKRE